MIQNIRIFSNNANHCIDYSFSQRFLLCSRSWLFSLVNLQMIMGSLHAHTNPRFYSQNVICVLSHEVSVSSKHMTRGPHEARGPMQRHRLHRRKAGPVKQRWSLQFKNKNIDRISDKSRILCESWWGEHCYNATGKHVQCTTVFLNVFQHAAHFCGQNFWRLTVLRQTIEFAKALTKRNIFVIVTFKSQNNFFRIVQGNVQVYNATH